MFKRILFYILFILIFIIPLKQDLNAQTWWTRRDTTVLAESILTAIDSGYMVTITGCKIFNPLIKEGTAEIRDTIESSIRIYHSTFFDIVSFKYCNFGNDVEFQFDSLQTDAIFDHSTFGGFNNFWSSTFDGEVSFEYATFNHNVSFNSATFDTNAYFREATFRGWAYFQEDSFSGDVSFSDAAFGEQADFRTTTFGKHANFARAIFPKYACFISATFDTVSFDGTKFEGGVDLKGMQFKGINIRWNQLEGCLYCNDLTSYKLMKDFEEKRMVNDADGVYLFLKDQERMEKPWYFRYPEFWFIQLTCGYGVKPGYTFLWSLGIIILFAFFYTLRFNSIKEIEKELRYTRRPRVLRTVRSNFRKRLYDAFYFSIHTFIIGIVSDWHPTDEFLIRTKKIKLFKFRTLSMIEGVLGWVLLVLFVVTLTRKFIR